MERLLPAHAGGTRGNAVIVQEKFRRSRGGARRSEPSLPGDRRPTGAAREGCGNGSHGVKDPGCGMVIIIIGGIYAAVKRPPSTSANLGWNSTRAADPSPLARKLGKPRRTLGRLASWERKRLEDTALIKR